MSKEVYKYRTCNGMATYTIISGVFGVDKILHITLSVETPSLRGGEETEIMPFFLLNNYYSFLSAKIQ